MKELIRNFLKRYGYDIIKTGVPYVPKTNKDVLVKVGKFEILMPGYNVQAANYKIYPDLNVSFGRLAKVIFSKYPDMYLIDVGANVGDTIAVVKSEVEIPIIGIEGDDVTYSYLEKNVKLFSNVSIIKTFLSEKTQDIKVEFEKSGWNATVIPNSNNGKQVSFKTLDEVIETGSFFSKNIKLLKVDVEGFDTIVLRGASNVIREHKPVLFFEYNRQNMITINEDGISTLLSYVDYGYNKIAFFDHKGALILVTSLKNKEEVTGLHDYASSPKNLIGYYDICIFHENDDELAKQFFDIEKENL
ncbi:MAG TPA: FkbM family methyltransferase [Chitinophagaceae bacterium]|jgi:FkbM family methyltransferase|nr:FkbM family methyltransferase [Chitinophagaceae bacterium]HMU59955.1 FkbM family methyltransferase [Chitinophagaceae bacterium]